MCGGLLTQFVADGGGYCHSLLCAEGLQTQFVVGGGLLTTFLKLIPAAAAGTVAASPIHHLTTVCTPASPPI